MHIQKRGACMLPYKHLCGHGLPRGFFDSKIELISPTLFSYEILNAINVAIKRKRIEEEAGYRAIH